MGRYVNQTSREQMGPSFDQKCRALMNDGAILTAKPTKFVPNLVCVVNNGWMAAAGYIYDEREFADFSDPNDVRQKSWFIWNKVEQYAQ